MGDKSQLAQSVAVNQALVACCEHAFILCTTKRMVKTL